MFKMTFVLVDGNKNFVVVVEDSDFKLAVVLGVLLTLVVEGKAFVMVENFKGVFVKTFVDSFSFAEVYDEVETVAVEILRNSDVYNDASMVLVPEKCGGTVETFKETVDAKYTVTRSAKARFSSNSNFSFVLRIAAS